MANHYTYRVDHDLGFAPHVFGRICTLCGCKRTTIERWARPGSWVIGIGGNGTGRPNEIIYAMRVSSKPTYGDLRLAGNRAVAYLKPYEISQDAPVLVSDHFYYFGDQAVEIPAQLAHIVHSTQGCKRLYDQDIQDLHALVLDRYALGRHGKPNNLSDSQCER